MQLCMQARVTAESRCFILSVVRPFRVSPRSGCKHDSLWVLRLSFSWFKDHWPSKKNRTSARRCVLRRCKFSKSLLLAYVSENVWSEVDSDFWAISNRQLTLKARLLINKCKGKEWSIQESSSQSSLLKAQGHDVQCIQDRTHPDLPSPHLSSAPSPKLGSRHGFDLRGTYSSPMTNWRRPKNILSINVSKKILPKFRLRIPALLQSNEA